MWRAVGSRAVFIARNLRCARDIDSFAAAWFGEFVVEPLSGRYLAAVDELYASLNDGERLGLPKTIVLRLAGARLCLIARHVDSGEVVGMVIYYFNARDRKEGTVHEGYIGLREAERGRGLGTFMRRHALRNFARSGLSGVSSRISTGNLASLRSNRSLGFVTVETYFDPSMGEKRYYLICDLSREADGSA